MKKITKLLLAGMASAFCCSIGNAQISYTNSLIGATLIYSNGFDGAMVNISNTPPDFATNLFGGTNTAVWIDAAGAGDTNAFYANGVVGTPQADSILLPFKPQANQVYTLTASVSFAGSTGSGDWVGVGFAQNYASPGLGNARFADSGVNGYDFAILTELTGNVQYFAGPHATAPIFGANGVFPANTPATQTVKFILDTTGTKWVCAGFINGVQISTNFTYASNPTIGALGMTQTTLAAGGQNNVHWNSLTLSAAQLVITRQPVSATVASGAPFTNSIAVSAGSPSYQWYQDGQPLPRPGQTNILNGVTNATLILNPALPADSSANYYVVVTNSSGSVTSAPATLTVVSAPTIAAAFPVNYTNVMTLYGAQTVSGTNYPGSTPTFSVSVIGAAPLSYQWLTNGVAVSGATKTTFTFTNTPLNGPTNFSVVVNNSGGSASNSWAVAYLPAPTAPFPSVVLGYNPSGYWRLNEGSDDNNGDQGVVTIDYASGNDGMYSNAILGNTGYSTSTDPSETSAIFSSFASPDSEVFGIQGIDFAAPTNTSAAFSVQAWVDGIGTQTSGAGIISKGFNGGEEYSLQVTNNKFAFLVRDVAGNAYMVTASTGPDNNWHFLVGVCDQINGAVSLYVDGVSAGSVSIAPGVGLLSSSRLITIGSRSSTSISDNDLQFKGSLDDVAVFNYALSVGQIVQEYSAVVNVAPYFVQTPPASVSVNAGSPLSLPASAAGTTPIGYTWTDVNTATTVASGSSNGLPLNATLTVGSVPGSWNGHQLQLTVTNAVGSTNVFVTLTVFTNLTIVNDLPTSLSLLSGASYTYSIGLVGPLPYAYQWYQAGVLVPGQTNSTLAVTAGVSGSTTYYVVVSNSFNVVTSLVSTLTTIAPLSTPYASGLLQLNPAGYWPMHEVTAPAPGDIETNYGSLGVLGTAYYPDWVADYGTVTRQVPGALIGDTDPATHFNWNVGALGNGVGTWTNELYIPHTSPASTLNPPFSVECWLLNTNTTIGGAALNQSVWGQLGWEGLNGGFAGSDTGTNISGTQLAYSSGGGMAVYGIFNGAQTQIISNPNVAPIGSWYHTVVTCDANTNFTLYVNGVNAGSAAGVGKYSPDSWSPLTIGGDRGGTRSAIINVDEFAVYTNVISDTAIATHYTDGISGSAGAYFHDVTNDQAVIYLRMDAPSYTAPGVGSWPELVNFGSVRSPGVYTPGTLPGVTAGPIATNGANFAGLSGTNTPAFSGVSSFADAGFASAYNPTGSNANFTVTAMFRGNPCDNRVQSIVSHGNNSWQLNMSTNGTVVFNAGNGGLANSGTGSSPGDIKTSHVYNDGKWHHVAAINGSNNVVTIYVDGVLDISGTPSGVTATSVIPGNTSDVMIGTDPSNTNNPTGVGRQFAGQVCEVAFLNQTLTATQVQNLYNAAVTGTVVSTTPTTLTFSVSGNQLTLSWPLDHTGWTLQAQTNSLGIGITTNWSNVAGSASTNQVVIPMNPAAGSAFYRLHLQF